MLEIRNLRVQYPGAAAPAVARVAAPVVASVVAPILAIDGVDLTIEPGEIVSVLGPSGSGKSTLLRTIAGLERPASGQLSWAGADLAEVPTHRRGFGLMFQDHALFPHRDVLGNVTFGLRMQGADNVEPRGRDVLASTGLAGYEHRNVYELSGGEQQRVALARALAPQPGLLMLDEPLGSLDRILRERLVQQLRAIFRELGVTVLAVTHDHEEAFALADRVVIMRAGRIEDDGPVERVWRRPRTPFAATFLGFDNSAEALVADGVTTSSWGRSAASGLPDGPATVMGRATGFVLDGHGTISGRVTDTAFRRNHFLVRLTTEHGPLDVAVDADRVPTLDSTVRVALRDNAAVVFPQA